MKVIQSNPTHEERKIERNRKRRGTQKSLFFHYFFGNKELYIQREKALVEFVLFYL
jgi:hypothetical protein